MVVPDELDHLVLRDSTTLYVVGIFEHDPARGKNELAVSHRVRDFQNCIHLVLRCIAKQHFKSAA